MSRCGVRTLAGIDVGEVIEKVAEFGATACLVGELAVDAKRP